MSQHQTKLRLFQGFWTVQDVIAHPDYLFVFGDNDVQCGKGGQAIIRGQSNAIGIPTKKYPNNYISSFYTDDELELNKSKIIAACNEIIRIAPHYTYIIMPQNGFGTGLADLQNKAPQTLQFLNNAIWYMMQII